MLSNRFRKVWALLFIAELFSFLPTLFEPVMHVDEGSFAMLSRHAFDGKLYRTVTDLKPPLLFQMYWLMTGGAHSLWLFHIVQIVWLFLGAIIFFKILSEVIDENAALFGSLIFALLSGRIEYGSGMPERLLLPFILLSIYLAIRVLKSKGRSYQYYGTFAVGFLVGAASVVKQPGGLLGIAAFGVLFLSKKRFLFLIIGIAGILSATFLVFGATQVPFETIWKEAYLVNFKYYMKAPVDAGRQSFEILKNLSAIYFLEYLGVFVGSLCAGIVLFRKALRSKFRFPRRSPFSLALLINSVLFVFALYAISLGGKWATNYQIFALIPLVGFTAFGIYKIKSKSYAHFLIGLCIFSNLIFHGIVFFQIKTDHFKNWDSKIQSVYKDILADTKPSDKIWVSHSIPSLYFMSRREPAVKYFFFMHNLKYADICVVPESQISSLRANAHYYETLLELRLRKPKVIFWVQRHLNGCTDKLKLSYFPEIQSLLSKFYVEKFKNSLGIYFLRKS